MRTTLRLSSLLLLGLGGFVGQAVSADLAQSLCSNQNTGSDYDTVPNNYQSDGSCQNTCAGYSFAIVQYTNCWCSNVAPSETVDVSQCSEACPGYPYENCGNEDAGLFGYIDLGKAPQGTASAPLSPAPSTPAPSSSSSPSPSPSPSDPPSSPSSPSSPSTTSPSSHTSTWSPTPSPSIMTVSGSVKTVVITPTIPPQATTTVTVPGAEPDNEGANTNNGGFLSNRGAVAGVFTIVGLIVAAAIAFAVWFFLLRRRRDTNGSERLNSFEEERGSRPPTFLSRKTSTLGLRTDFGGMMTRGADSEKTPTGSQMAQTPGTMSRRTSIPLTDQRLNATALFHDNGSHMSVTSLQDNQDYSRPVLQIANPDRPGSSAIMDD